ncbi:MAG TPA: ABC transporter permease [Candidatus Limnocylindria bacterium]|nr:ABC transporter permease [Candidatus Limnocylindria bacterium]
MTAAPRVFQRNLLVYLHTWRGGLFFSFLQPVMFLTAMGIGVGALITSGNRELLGGVPYLHFLGPGLLATTAMQTATFESTFPIMNRIMWGRNYEAMLTTPLTVRDLVWGELAWVAFRMVSIAVVFLVVLTLFGIVRTPLAVLAIGVAVLIGIGFSAWLIAFTATQKNDVGFSAIFRFVINPLFLFSGTFFPLAQLPDQIEWVAALTPLFHGVELIRGLVLDRLDVVAAAGHVAYLAVFFGIGAWLARRSLQRRMVS